MSLILIIDGYNVVAPVAAPGRLSATGQSSDRRWLENERKRLLQRLRDNLQSTVLSRVCVVFDARHRPPGAVDRYDYHGIDVRFAIEYPEADDLIEDLIAKHSSPKQLAVVSSDHRLQEAARRRGATPLDSQPWMDKLLDGKAWLPVSVERAKSPANLESQSGKPTEKVTDDEVKQWMEEFGFDENES